MKRKQNGKELIPEQKSGSDGLRQAGEQRDGSQTTGILLFSLDGHCGITEPHQANKALPTQQASTAQGGTVPSARCEGEGKESTGGRRAGRFLQKGLDLIKLIFFSNI